MKHIFCKLLVMLPLVLCTQQTKADDMIDVQFSKVTDFSTLTDGDEIIIVNEKEKLALGPNPTSGKNRLGKDVVFTDGKITSMSTLVSVITLEKDGEGWFLKVSDGYIAIKYNHLSDDKYYVTSEPTSTPSSTKSGTKAVLNVAANGNPCFTFTFEGKSNKTQNKYIEYGTRNFSPSDYIPETNSNVTIYRRTDIQTIEYDESSDMSATISENLNKEGVIVNLNRTFTADDGWYSLCLPFTVTQRQIKAIFGDDVNIQEFDGAEKNGDVVFVNFMGVTTDLQAGKPYLVKTKKTVVNPSFKQVTISTTTSTEIIKGDYKFIGIFSPFDIPVNDKTYRFLSGTNGKQLDYAAPGSAPLKGTRAYFRFPESASSSSANAITEDELGIVTINNNTKKHIVFTIDGRPIDSSKQNKLNGIYIVDGKTTIIRK